MRAYVLIREGPAYRRRVFLDGLAAAGLEPELRHPEKPGPGTILIIWNRYNESHLHAERVEAAGGRVWVAENGYLGRGGSSPKFDVNKEGPQPGSYYALGESFHNGGGWWPSGGPERWEALGVELKPWRQGGEYLLICPNRSFGVAGRMMHADWAERRAAALSSAGAGPVRVRLHPGNDAPRRPLSEDLAGARAVLVWSSSAGVHALAEGIPTYCDAPFWILKGAAPQLPKDGILPTMPDRLPHFQRMAWAQWTCEEIESGRPFRHMLSAAR